MVDKERQVQIDIARESGKPEAVIEKMIEGRMKKYMAEVTLLGQAFVINPDLTVEAAAKDAGAEIRAMCAWKWAKASRRRKRISRLKSRRPCRAEARRSTMQILK